MSALLFGSISTLADTSELQRRAFNEAFSAHGLDWNWDREDYQSMLGSNGGKQRVADYASSRGEDVDAAAVHATKSKIFQTLVIDEGVAPRPGVAETIQRVKSDGHRLALVTTTSSANVKALLAALQQDLGADTFDLVVDSTSVDEPKPNPAAYAYALNTLGEGAARVVAIEDNEGGVKSAAAAGVRCIAFPNENTVDGDFSAATEKVDALDADHIAGLIEA
jgi:HAD superfamily hydrolase (TIGR01509 family)